MLQSVNYGINCEEQVKLKTRACIQLNLASRKYWSLIMSFRQSCFRNTTIPIQK
jgi:hypothetical protein